MSAYNGSTELRGSSSFLTSLTFLWHVWDDIHWDIHNTYKREVNMHAVSLITFFIWRMLLFWRLWKGKRQEKRIGKARSETRRAQENRLDLVSRLQSNWRPNVFLECKIWQKFPGIWIPHLLVLYLLLCENIDQNHIRTTSFYCV